MAIKVKGIVAAPARARVGARNQHLEAQSLAVKPRKYALLRFSLQLHKPVTRVGSPSFCSALSKHLAEGSSREPPSSADKMAEYKPQAVKDVPANDFIKAYAAHLKSTDKVSNLQPSHT